MKQYIALLALSGMLLAFAGCSQDPGETGRGLISPNDKVSLASVSYEATGDTTFVSRIVGSTAIVGITHDVESRALMQFKGLTTVASTVTIDSAVVSIPLKYRFPDSSGTLSFTVYEMLISWSSSSISWSNSDSTGVHSTTSQLVYLGQIRNSDTVLRFHVDSLVQRWIKHSTDIPYGIILIPNAISSDIIAGTRFSDHSSSTADIRPVLTISYRDTADTTKTVIIYSAQQAFVANSSYPVAGGKVMTQAGVALRGLVRFSQFSLPANVSITKASLRIVRDDVNTLGNQATHDSVVSFLLMKNSPPYDSLALAAVLSPADTAGRRIYTADIRSIVQQWIVHRPNYGVVIRGYSEASMFDRFSFYGSSAPAGLRPRLTITYTILP